MTSRKIISGETAKKVLLNNLGDPGNDHSAALNPSSGKDQRLETDEKTAADDLVKLVLALVETVRQLMERQAIRRVESGSLSDDEIERLGITLLRLEERMAELKTHFGMAEEDLSLRLGTVQDLMDILEEDLDPEKSGDQTTTTSQKEKNSGQG